MKGIWFSGCVGGYCGDDFAFALHDADHGRFTLCATTALARPNATDISLIGFDLTAKHRAFQKA